MLFINNLENWKYTPILSWTDLSRNYPWGTLTLVGAGLSIAEAFQVDRLFLFSLLWFVCWSKVSKLSNTFADALKFVDHSPDFVVLITIIILSEICTQFINNLSIGMFNWSFHPILLVYFIASILFPVISTLVCDQSVQRKDLNHF